MFERGLLPRVRDRAGVEMMGMGRRRLRSWRRRRDGSGARDVILILLRTLVAITVYASVGLHFVIVVACHIRITRSTTLVQTFTGRRGVRAASTAGRAELQGKKGYVFSVTSSLRVQLLTKLLYDGEEDTDLDFRLWPRGGPRGDSA